MELTEALLVKIAGWEAVKMARALLQERRVRHSKWAAPVLSGTVEEGGNTYRAGLVIKDLINIDNVCSCRTSRQWGTICAHSVAVGLHWLTPKVSPTASEAPREQTPARAVADLRPAPAAAAPRWWVAQEEANAAEVSAEVSVVFPPNTAVALAKGKLMLCFEVKTARGRGPMNALPRESRWVVSAADAALLRQLEPWTQGQPVAMCQLAAQELTQLLPALVGHPRLTLGKAQSLRVLAEPLRRRFRAALQPNGEIVLEHEQPASAGEWALVSGAQATWAFADATFRPVRVPPQVTAGPGSKQVIPRSQVPVFLSQVWPGLSETQEVAADFSIDQFELAPRPPKFHLHLAGGLARLEARLQCAYGPRIMTLGVTQNDEPTWLADPDHPTRYSTRDVASERAAVARLQQSGFHGPDTQGKLLLTGETPVLTFLAREFPRLESIWTVTLEANLSRSTEQKVERIEPTMRITTSGERWFDVDIEYAAAGGERFSAAEMQRLILSGQSHTRLKSGKWALIDTGAVEELQEVLLDCAPVQDGGHYRIAQTQSAFLEQSVREQKAWRLEAPAQWRQRAAQQHGTVDMTPTHLGALASILRPYQKHGVAWLQFLRAHHFGGILADEMGLGKTLQTLAFWHSIRAESSGAPASDRGPMLVICPTSLVFNWTEEARRFTPSLRVLALHGPQRQARFAEMAEADLVITSYALIRRDAEWYRNVEFDTVVLDEAQHIKNRQTQNAQAVKAIRAAHRLVLTGTPLENSVLDLWSIFDFLMPGYLGSAQDFRERYEAPIVRERNQEAQARLARRVKPFLLRRLKRDVAAELPAKIEQVSYCELSEEQRAAYQQVLEAGRREVLAAAGAAGANKGRIAALNALLRLRQICCDLRLLPLDGAPSAAASGKMELLDELLEEIVDGGHRVLIFSQFVEMLKLVVARLESESISFCYLDGSTRDRPAVVARFQNDPSIPVFLISLKAGGVGLNLTGADTVIHLDPWWNPAVEDQATDRAHRIGQARVVTSYKLIARGTVEEKILTLQQRKRDLIRGTLTDADALAEALSWDEIQGLLTEP